jgi:hypothetical protein
MRKHMIVAALVSTVFATPAIARDGAPYVAIDAGLLRPSPLNLRLTTSSATIEHAIRVRHKLGIDADAVFGYDFGMFRVEGELGYKYGKLNGADIKSSALVLEGTSTQGTDFQRPRRSWSRGRSQPLVRRRHWWCQGQLQLGPQSV